MFVFCLSEQSATYVPVHQEKKTVSAHSSTSGMYKKSCTGFFFSLLFSYYILLFVIFFFQSNLQHTSLNILKNVKLVSLQLPVVSKTLL